jgi:hypothetical protein
VIVGEDPIIWRPDERVGPAGEGMAWAADGAGFGASASPAQYSAVPARNCCIEGKRGRAGTVDASGSSQACASQLEVPWCPDHGGGDDGSEHRTERCRRPCATCGSRSTVQKSCK